MQNEKIIIDSNIYNNNLDFYTMLKLLVQCHFSAKQLIYIQDLVIKNKENILINSNLLKTLLIDSNIIGKINANKYASLNYFLNTSESINLKMWCEFLDICVDLLLVKDLILQESKVYAFNEQKKELKNIYDMLSIEYDISHLHLPYGQRVISSLLLFALTNANRESNFILNSSNTIVKNFSHKVQILTEQYNLNVNNMFHIIMDESMNQSIKSDAGSSYESRVFSTLSPLVQKINGHSHDSKISSVEYDMTFIFNNKLCGVSAKRTLRERYKQNFEDVKFLDVNYMFFITLGTDLTEDKLTNILQKSGIYIIVSQEEHEARAFLKNNNKVISSKNIKEAFIKIIK